jgi:hypothetical protein
MKIKVKRLCVICTCHLPWRNIINMQFIRYLYLCFPRFGLTTQEVLTKEESYFIIVQFNKKKTIKRAEILIGILLPP